MFGTGPLPITFILSGECELSEIQINLYFNVLETNVVAKTRRTKGDQPAQ